jgi:outer membrane protein assembly factor BamD
MKVQAPRMWAFVIVAGVLVNVGAVGCAPEAKSALSYSDNARRAYEQAMVDFEAHDWLEAQALFREVKRKYSYSRYARLAELRIADADFEQEKYVEAIRGYRQFVHDHRSETTDVAFARSRIAEAQYREISDSFILPSSSERDQAVVLDAYRELKSYLHDYPDAKQSARVRELLTEVTSRLIRHELYVAQFYLQRDNYEAAAARIRYALRNYAAGGDPLAQGGGPAPGIQVVGLEPEALLLLGETYLRMKKTTDARGAFAAIVRVYPESALSVQARRYLERLS